jgi:Fe-S cluster assembly protein SufD
MTQTATDERYNTDFAALSDERKHEPSWLRDLRRKGIDAFTELGFPTARRGNEAWKYTDIRPIAAATFEHPKVAGDLSATQLETLLPFDGTLSRIVFVDGFFVEGLSRLANDSAEVLPLSEAIASRGELVRKHLAQHSNPHHDFSCGLNTALWRDGALVHAVGQTGPAIHVVYITSEHSIPVVTYPRTLVVAEPMSEVLIVETYISLGEMNHFTDPVTEIALAEGAIVRHSRLLLENKRAYHVGHVRVAHKRDSNFESVAYAAGGGLVRVDLEVELSEPGASATVNGLYVTSGDQHIDNLINIDHAAPHCTSRLYYKGILDDRSRAVFGGTVFVRKGADKTDAHQEDKNLLLSHEAEVDSKPALEIYADDVKAGHGATAGAIADEALFYMQSRGLDAETAMQFLVRGFAAEIIETVAMEPLREWLEAHTLDALPRFAREEAVR